MSSKGSMQNKVLELTATSAAVGQLIRYADGPEIFFSVESVNGTRIRVGSGQS